MTTASDFFGVWQLVRFDARDVATNIVTPSRLGRPYGHTIMTPGGRMFASGFAEVEHVPSFPATPDDCVTLFDSRFFYEGAYRLEHDRLVYDVSRSWNGTWSGKRFLRTYVILDDTLVLETTPFPGRAACKLFGDHVADLANITAISTFHLKERL